MDPIKWRERYASEEGESEDEEVVPRELTDAQKSFYNAGYHNFTRTRDQWATLPNKSSRAAAAIASASSSGDSMHDDDSSSSSSSSSSGSSSSGHSSSDSDDPTINVPAIMECLRNMQPFTKAIKLSAMVDILTVIWEDECE